MKEIKAIVRPNKLPQIRKALMGLDGFPGMTISQAEGCSSMWKPRIIARMPLPEPSPSWETLR